MVELVVIVGLFGVVLPALWWLCAIIGFVGFVVGPRAMTCFCFKSGYYIDNPFRPAQLIATGLICIAAWRWRRVRPTRLPVLRRIAMYSAVTTILTTAVSFDGAESYDTYHFVLVALVSSIVLLARLVLEVRLHVPPLPIATARVVAPPLDRTGP
jgi:hypothetical protein